LDAGISIDTSAVVHPVDPGDIIDIIKRSRYAHDRNGNLTYDMELQTNFAYNILNLLEKAMRNDTIVANYSYLADGTKLSAVNADDCGFAYRGSFTYRADAGGDRVFESTPFGGGRIVATADKETVARYFLTDHLGKRACRGDRPKQRPRTQRLLSFRKTLELCIAANFGQPQPVQRQGGSSIHRRLSRGLRRPNVRPRTRTMALARSLAAIP